MDYQEWPLDVQKWLCIMIGRSMYDLGELEEWQILAYLLGTACSGKSMVRGTKILCYDGSFKEVQDLRKGDVLMGDDSKPRNVLSCSSGIDMMYKVKQTNGMDYIVNGLHELCLKMTYCAKGHNYRIINGRKYRKGDIVEITVQSYMKLSKSQQKALKGYKVGIDFEERKVSVEPYILGLSLGYPSTNQTNEGIPDMYKINSRTNRLELLAGLIDSNPPQTSQTSQTYATIEVSKHSNKLYKDIHYLVHSLGFYTKTNEYQKYYLIRIYGNLEIIPSRISKRPQQKIKKMRNLLYTEIEIEKHEVDYFYGVQLDGNHHLILEDFTVAHNSTILTKIVKMIYEPCDVGVLSNNIEKKFGLYALSEKFMFVGPEIKGNLSLEQSEFQSLISGEDIQVAEKHKVAKSVVWKVPGMLAGNEVPSYTDNAGSISRRLMVFKFDKKVKKGDSRLGNKLLNEIPYIIQACNRAYQEAVNTYSEKDIWSIVPEYFRETKETMAQNTNALMNFLNSDKITLGQELYVRERLFITTFNEHCRDNHLGTHKWNSDYYLGPFDSKNLTIRKGMRLRYPNIPGARTYGGSFIFGVDVVSDFDNNDDDNDPEYN